MTVGLTDPRHSMNSDLPPMSTIPGHPRRRGLYRLPGLGLQVCLLLIERGVGLDEGQMQTVLLQRPSEVVDFAAA